MNQRPIRRLAIAAALLTLLTLTAPAQAAGWSSWTPKSPVLQTAWHWVSSFWGAPVSPAPGVPVKSDRSSGIDPNGGTSSATTSPCPVNCDRSSGIDPNG
jgi:hypothetical protein